MSRTNGHSTPSAYPASVQAGIPQLPATPPGWTRVPLGKLLRPVYRPVEIRDDDIYQLVTAKRSRAGIVARGRLPGSAIKVKDQYEVRSGDFILSNRQIAHGGVGLVPTSLNGAIVSGEYTVLESLGPIDLDFLSALTHSAYFQQICFHSSIGVHVEKLVFRLEDWLRWEINLPPLSEQQRIAAAIAAMTRVIDGTETLVAAKRKRRTGYLQTRLFGKPESTSSSSEMSLTQKRLTGSNAWPMLRIGDFASEVSRLNRAGEDMPVLSCTKHAGVVLSAEYFSGRRVHAEDTSGYKIVRRGEFVYATNHLEEGSIGLQHLVDAGVVSPMYTVFGVNDALVDRDFLFAVLKTETYRQVFQINTAASVDRRGGLRWDEFASLPFALPSLAEQQAIASALGALDADIASDVTRLNALRTQRRGLMQKLLTGEWRLSTDASEQAA